MDQNTYRNNQSFQIDDSITAEDLDTSVTADLNRTHPGAQRPQTTSPQTTMATNTNTTTGTAPTTSTAPSTTIPQVFNRGTNQNNVYVPNASFATASTS